MSERDQLVALLHDITTMNGIGCAHPGKPLAVLEPDCEKVADELIAAGFGLVPIVHGDYCDADLRRDSCVCADRAAALRYRS